MTNNSLQTILLMFSVIGGVISLILGVMKYTKLALIVSSAALVLIGFVTVLGYVADVPQIYTFPGNKTSVALPTGVCFLIIGIWQIILINHIDFKNKKQ